MHRRVRVLAARETIACPTAAVALTAAAIATFQVVIAAALVWTLPGFAASLLTGQSTVSGAAVMQQAVSSMAGASQAMAQLGSANRAENRGRESRTELAEVSKGASNGQPANGPGSTPAAPDQTAETLRGSNGSGVNGLPGTNGATGTGGAAGGIGVTTGSGGGGRNVLPNPGATTPGRGADMVSGALSPTSPRQPQSFETVSNGSQASLPPTQPAASQSPTSRGLSTQGSFTSESSSSSGSNVSVPPNVQARQGTTGAGQTDRPAANGSVGFGEMQAEQIRGITSQAEANRIASATEWKDLSKDTKDDVMRNQYAREAMRERLAWSERESQRDEQFADAYMLGGLAQVAPREIGQPTAVQVRISNPDKL